MSHLIERETSLHQPTVYAMVAWNRMSGKLAELTRAARQVQTARRLGQGRRVMTQEGWMEDEIVHLAGVCAGDILTPVKRQYQARSLAYPEAQLTSEVNA